MPFKKTTAEQIQQAEELLGIHRLPRPKYSELTFAEIAEKTGLSAATVGKLAYNRVLPPPTKGRKGIGRPKGEGKKWSPNRARVRDLWAGGNGKTPNAIAEKIGITPAGVRRIIKLQVELEATVRQLAEQHVPAEQIAQETGLELAEVLAILSVGKK